MIDTAGTVIAIDGDYAIVRVDSGGCGRCDEPGGCRGANIGKMLCSTPATFRVRNTAGAIVGARATIAVADGAVQRSALAAYGLPLLLLLAGAIAGFAAAADAGAIAGAGIGLVAAWLSLRGLARRSRHDVRFEPYLRP